MNSMVLSVVSIDGGGNGEGLIKVPMMGNIKLGVRLSGIQVAEGGCIVGGRAELSGVAISLLTDKQKAELTKAYNTVTAITQTAVENAGAIAETYNGLSGVLNAVKDKANAIANKIANGGTPTKTELAALQQAANQGAAQMQTSLDAMRAGLGDKINAELANNMQAQIDKIKTNAVAIANPATAQVAAVELAKTDPVAIVKNTKKLGNLSVEYNGRNYSKNGTVLKMQPGELGGLVQNSGDIPLNCGFYLKNMVEGEPISWKLQTSSGTDLALEAPLRVSASATDAYLGIKWPDGQTSLKLTVVSGDRSLNLTLQKPEWFVKDLVVSETRRIQKYDITNGKITQGKTNTRTAKAGETLYLVHDNNLFTTDRKPVYKFTSNLDDALLKKYITHHNYSSGTNYTFENSSGPTSHKLPMTYDDVPGVFGVNINTLSYNKTVKVQLVPFDKREDEYVMPAPIKQTIEGIAGAFKKIKDVQETIDDIFGKTSRQEFSWDIQIVKNNQTYNEEDPKSQNFKAIKEWESKIVVSGDIKMKFGGTAVLPKALTEYFELYGYVGISGDLEFIIGEKLRKINNLGKEEVDEKTGKIQGVVGLKGGITGKLKAPSIIEGSVDANLKMEFEAGANFPTKTFSLVRKPLVLNLSARIAMSAADITLFQYNYIKNLTNENKIYETTWK